MRLSLRAKQVAGVTAIVFTVVAIMGGYAVVTLAGMLVAEARTRADLIANGVFQRTADVVAAGGDLRTALGSDAGLRGMLDLTAYSPNVLYAAVVDRDDIALAHNDPSKVGMRLPPEEPISSLVEASPWAQARAIYTTGGMTHEVRVPLLLDSGSGPEEFGAIRVGISTLLVRDALETTMRPAVVTAAALLIGAVLVALVLAQWLLRPILMLRAGLARLGQGDTDVTLDLGTQDEFGLGESFNTISARLAREHAAGEITRATMSRRLAALGRVSSGIAHEVKNPLNAMRLHLELLRMRTSDTPDAAEHVRVLAEQMRRLDEVVQGFLQFARPEDLTFAAVKPRALIDAILPVVKGEADRAAVSVVLDAPATVPAVRADATLLEQALMNLAINACHAMPNGGTLTLSARQREDGQIELAVTDTGTGISPEHLDKIFNLYFTTKPDGSGIGLALVYRTISMHDGDITVESVPGAGTTFRITLPAFA
jgi:signal transduction histidine kinase